uniref:TFIIS domain containing protein n=1 Tax=Marseillevirus sp. TaxID=2809551 RepID=A0AA96J136_9VIRU|nr:TFIIS domain containing protein [Marseillevirus sp.]
MSVRKLALEQLRIAFPEKAEAIEKKMNINVTNLCKKLGIKPGKDNPKFMEFATFYYYNTLGACLNAKHKPGAVKDLNGRKLDFECEFFKEEAEKEELLIELVLKPLVVQNGFVKCIKCKSKNTVSIVVQTRSGDEMATAFVDCLSCGESFVSHE